MSMSMMVEILVPVYSNDHELRPWQVMFIFLIYFYVTSVNVLPALQ
jgi:hypothetical protein